MRQRAGDGEVVDAARGLDSVVGGIGDLQVAQRVLLDTEPGAGSWGSGGARGRNAGSRFRLSDIGYMYRDPCRDGMLHSRCCYKT